MILNFILTRIQSQVPILKHGCGQIISGSAQVIGKLNKAPHSAQFILHQHDYRTEALSTDQVNSTSLKQLQVP